ncbi:hypothetical protein P3G55_15410 [Leptospira sp. 96542]|nr:hypothetical protein [Leptospira sp. 96542]
MFRLIFLLLLPLGSIVSSELKVPNQIFVWKGISLRVPEASVVKEEGGMHPKLVIYPAKLDGYFMVVRILAWPYPGESKEWGDSVFTRSTLVQKSVKEISGISFYVWEADQVRNQNLLHNQVWVSKDSPSVWIWVQWKKDRTDIEPFFLKHQFLGLSPTL